MFCVAVSLERGPFNIVSINEELLERRVAAPVLATEINDRGGNRRVDHATPLYPQKLALNFADKWRSLSLYSSLVDYGPRNLFFVCEWNHKETFVCATAKRPIPSVL
jgi:hypothetical protein